MNLIKNKRKKKKELRFSVSVIYMVFKLVCSVARKTDMTVCVCVAK